MSQMLLVLMVIAALAAPAIATPMFARPASQTVSEALAGPALERELDRQYWLPLKHQLEALRRQSP